MIRSRGPAGPSRATPQTLCQKCLKRDNYECQATAQERPYSSRPSRTQQLANPKLVPKLASDSPNDLLRKKGVADELLAKNEEARGRKRSRSASSTDSVSTISTNRSRSGSYPVEMKVDYNDDIYTSQQDPPIRDRSRKRQRSVSTASSESTSSRDYSSRARKRSSLRTDDTRNTRRRRSSVSPRARGRDIHHDHSRERRRRKSRSDSMDRSRIARHRNSLTPVPREKHDITNSPRTERRSWGNDGERQSNLRVLDDDPYSRDSRGYNDARRGDRGRPDANGPTNGYENQSLPPPRKRSLSPFSKRRELTKAMNLGR